MLGALENRQFPPRYSTRVSSKANSLSKGPGVGMRRCTWRVCVPGEGEHRAHLGEELGPEHGGRRHLRSSPAPPPCCAKRHLPCMPGNVATQPLLSYSRAPTPTPQISKVFQYVGLTSLLTLRLVSCWAGSSVFRDAEAGK